MKKVAIFVDVDWETIPEYVEMEKIRIISNGVSKRNYNKTQYFKFDNVQHVLSLIKSPLEANEEIYKIFFYAAEPMPKNFLYLCNIEDFMLKMIEYDLDNDKYSKYSDMLLREYIKKYEQEYPDKFDEIKKAIKGIENNHKLLKEQDYFNMRLCEQEINFKFFFQKSKVFIFEQRTHKWINMLSFGLDIASVSYKRLVDTAVVFSKDKDIIPALECARMNDVLVRLIKIRESANDIPQELRNHADEFREISLEDVVEREKAKEIRLH
ncbi:MAG: NYN domain-containing protein [Helicobacter sp.]|nr:NYN domain-containing protein [Helicobacter sp.]